MVENFRCFEDKMEINLYKIRDYKYNDICISNNLVSKSIIYGKNSVGKSNLGYALMDIRNTLIVDSLSFGDEAGYINALSGKKEASFSYTFILGGNELTYSYSKKSIHELTREELNVNGKTLYKCDFIENKYFLDELKQYDGLDALKLSSWKEGTPLLRFILFYGNLNELTVLNSLYKFVEGMALLRSVDGNFAFGGPKVLSSGIVKTIVEKDLKDDLERFLQSVEIDVKLKLDIKPDGEKTLYFDYKKPLEFARNASSGTRALTAIFTVVHQIDKISFLYVDEIDANLHFSLAEKMIQSMKEKLNTQILLTTHNTDLMSNKIMRPDCYFILTKNKFVSLSDSTDRELREGHNLEKLFHSGEFNV